MKSGDDNGSIGAGWRIDRPAAILAEAREHILMRLGRNIRDVVFAERLPAEGRRPGGKWLSRGRLFPRHIRTRHRTFLDRKQRGTGHSIEQKYLAGFGDLGNRFPFLAVVFDRYEIWASGQVMVPEIVMKRLKMPPSFSGGCIQANHAIRKQIVALPGSSIKIRRSRTCADKNQPALFIHRRAAP